MFSGSEEKLREGGSECDHGDLLRGWEIRSHGAQPGAEGGPDEAGVGGGEELGEPLGDESDLDVAMIGGDFAADGISVVIRLPMEVLVSVAAVDGDHGFHPEAIGIGAEGVDGLFEPCLSG